MSTKKPFDTLYVDANENEEGGYLRAFQNPLKLMVEDGDYEQVTYLLVYKFERVVVAKTTFSITNAPEKKPKKK